ncbi:MAG: helix-turn-helix domain-containing protein [Clostridia bacterium]|nr:helix-turn-helix domain-containing protein [Clostridia bacterium]
MDNYITGSMIRQHREKKQLTQQQLADRLGVSSKTVSKWETARGLPDISLLLPLADLLGLSVIELMKGHSIDNGNRSANLLRSLFYVCPVCGNVFHASGEAVVSCCGITLPPLIAEEADEGHRLTIEAVEDEHFLTVSHPMTKRHFISFLAFVTGDRLQLVRLYPEGAAETRLQLRGHGVLYWYCNRHGLFRQKHPARPRLLQDGGR